MNATVNSTVVVTGATSGIGRCLTVKLLQAGAKVACCGRSEPKMAQLLQDTNDFVPNRYHETFDITNEPDIQRFVRNAEVHLGPIDILVNCAGVNSAKAPVTEIKSADLDWMLKVNLIAPFIFMREVYPPMKARRSGLVINVLSSVCLFTNEGVGAYTASKAGFDALTKVFRKEARECNVRVCSFYPGGVDTPFRDIPKPAYLDPGTVADAIISTMCYDEKASVDEIVMRPMVEKNF